MEKYDLITLLVLCLFQILHAYKDSVRIKEINKEIELLKLTFQVTSFPEEKTCSYNLKKETPHNEN